MNERTSAPRRPVIVVSRATPVSTSVCAVTLMKTFASAYDFETPIRSTTNASALACAVACMVGTHEKSDTVRPVRCAPSSTWTVVAPVSWRPFGL